MSLPALLLAASFTVFDDTIVVPASQWRAVELKNVSLPARVDGVFSVTAGGSGVRILLMTYLDLQKMRDGQPHSVIAATPYVRAGSISRILQQQERYVMVIDNRQERAGAEVRVRVKADPETAQPLAPRYASPGRQIAVIAGGITFLLLAVAYSLQQWRHR
jgi:hypothetical protein